MCGRYTYYSSEKIVQEYDHLPEPDVQTALELVDFGGAVLESIAGEDSQQSICVHAATIDPHDGKLICLLEASAVKLPES